MQTKQLTGFSLIEFLQLAQEHILAGWKFDFEDNDRVPGKFGNVYEAIMTKEDEVEAVEDSAVVAETQQASVGRKKKVQAAE